MKGLLLRDWYGVRGWMVFAISAMLVGYTLCDHSMGSQLIYSVLPQLLVMLPIRMLVLTDRSSGWKNLTDTTSHGRRRYVSEKVFLLLILGAALLLVWLCVRVIDIAGDFRSLRYVLSVYREAGEVPPFPTDFGGYLWYRLAGSFTAMAKFSLVYFFFLSAVQLPVLLLTSGWFTELWEMLTWALSWPVILWLREGPYIRFLLTKESDAVLPQSQWYSYPWTTILAAAVVLFVLSAGLTIWFSDRVRSDGISPAQNSEPDDQPMRTALRKAVVFLVTAAVAVSLGLCIRQALPVKTIYLYSTAVDVPSFLITNQEPSEIADRPEYKGYIPRLWYHADYADAQIIGAAGNQCLVWDGGWYLVELTSKEKTPVPIPGKPHIAYTQLLGEANPTAVALWDEAAQAFAFYSFEAERLVTGYEYARFEDDLVNGCIAAQGLDGTMVYVDPSDGTIVA